MKRVGYSEVIEILEQMRSNAENKDNQALINSFIDELNSYRRNFKSTFLTIKTIRMVSDIAIDRLLARQPLFKCISEMDEVRGQVDYIRKMTYDLISLLW